MQDKRYQVLALIGKAGAGKDAIQTASCHLHPTIFNKIVSCTTRPPRDNEKDGVDYHFLSVEDFTRKVLNGDMLEATEFRGWFYGTSIDSLVEDKINIGVFNPAGIEALLEMPGISVMVVLVEAKDKTRLMRYLQRSENPDCTEMCRRYTTDEKDFADLSFDYYQLTNEDGDCLDVTDENRLKTPLARMWYQTGAPLEIFEESTRKLIKAKTTDNLDNTD